MVRVTVGAILCPRVSASTAQIRWGESFCGPTTYDVSGPVAHDPHIVHQHHTPITPLKQEVFVESPQNHEQKLLETGLANHMVLLSQKFSLYLYPPSGMRLPLMHDARVMIAFASCTAGASRIMILVLCPTRPPLELAFAQRQEGLGENGLCISQYAALWTTASGII